MDILDLYSLLPIRKTKWASGSSDIYMCLTGNKQIGATAEKQEMSSTIQKSLELLWIKLEEKFKNMGIAFRYFDKNYNNSVSFSEFQNSLDTLKIKFSIQTIHEIFAFLDRDKKGYITYYDFCELTEERRRGIDPFRNENNADYGSNSNSKFD